MWPGAPASLLLGAMTLPSPSCLRTAASLRSCGDPLVAGAAELLCSVTVIVSPTRAWTTPGSCDSATVVVLAAVGLGLGLALAARARSSRCSAAGAHPEREERRRSDHPDDSDLPAHVPPPLACPRSASRRPAIGGAAQPRTDESLLPTRTRRRRMPLVAPTPAGPLAAIVGGRVPKAHGQGASREAACGCTGRMSQPGSRWTGDGETGGPQAAAAVRTRRGGRAAAARAS